MSHDYQETESAKDNAQSRLRDNLTPTPDELLQQAQEGDLPQCIVLCESGSWRSRQVAVTLQHWQVDAQALEGGTGLLANINRYGHSDFQVLPEDKREDVIRVIGRVPVLLVILNREEIELYSTLIEKLQRNFDRNKGIFIHAMNKTDAEEKYAKDILHRTM